MYVVDISLPDYISPPAYATITRGQNTYIGLSVATTQDLVYFTEWNRTKQNNSTELFRYKIQNRTSRHRQKHVIYLAIYNIIYQQLYPCTCMQVISIYHTLTDAHDFIICSYINVFIACSSKLAHASTHAILVLLMQKNHIFCCVVVVIIVVLQINKINLNT